MGKKVNLHRYKKKKTQVNVTAKKKKTRMQTSSVKSPYYNTAADKAVMTGDNHWLCDGHYTGHYSPASTESIWHRLHYSITHRTNNLTVFVLLLLILILLIVEFFCSSIMSVNQYTSRKNKGLCSRLFICVSSINGNSNWQAFESNQYCQKKTLKLC